MDKQTLKAVKFFVLTRSPFIIPHLKSVAKVAISLAKAHNVDPIKAELASWGHDIFRLSTESTLKKLIEKHKSNLKEYIDLGMPIDVYHGPLSSFEFPEKFNYTDKEVLDAIHNHTIISPNPNKLEAILFIADKLEPRKTKKDCEGILDEAHQDLYKGLTPLVMRMVKHHEKQGLSVHPNFIKYFANHS